MMRVWPPVVLSPRIGLQNNAVPAVLPSYRRYQYRYSRTEGRDRPTSRSVSGINVLVVHHRSFIFYLLPTNSWWWIFGGWWVDCIALQNEQRRSLPSPSWRHSYSYSYSYSYSPTKRRTGPTSRSVLNQFQNKETGMKIGTIGTAAAALQTPTTHSYSWVAVPHHPLTVRTPGKKNIWPSIHSPTNNNNNTHSTKQSPEKDPIQQESSVSANPTEKKRHTDCRVVSVYISPCRPWCDSTQSICRLCVAKERGREAARHHIMLPGNQDYQ
jgi:hypothetical protein